MHHPAAHLVALLMGLAPLAIADQALPTSGPAKAMSPEAATRPAVARAAFDERAMMALMNPPVDSLPPELREQHAMAMFWTLRKRMESAKPQQRQKLVEQLKTWAVESLRTGDEGMTSTVLGSVFVVTGDAATPVMLDFLAGEPGVEPQHAARLAGIATCAFIADRAARSGAANEAQPFPEVLAGVRMLPQRSLSAGLDQHVPRLIALLEITANRVDAEKDAGGPDWALESPDEVSLLATFVAVASVGEQLGELYADLMRLSEGRSPLASDLAVAVAAAVDPKRLSNDPAAVEKLMRAGARNPHVAMLAGPAHRERLADASIAAMNAADPLHQRGGLVLGIMVVEGTFHTTWHELESSASLAKRLRPAVQKLLASPDPAVRAKAVEVENSLDLAMMFDDDMPPR